MTSTERLKFSTVFNAQSSETSDEEHSLQRCLSLTHADQEDTASVSGISEPLKDTEEPQTQILKHDLEIPPQAKITSIPLSSFPHKMQQLMSARARQTTEIATVTYIWPVLKVEEASRPFWDNFIKSLIPTSSNLTRYSSSPDVATEGARCSQTASVKQLAQEEVDRKTPRTYSLIVKSSNSFVSGVLKSLSNIRNKDYKSMIPFSPISPLGEQLEIPLFQGNAILIYGEQVYLLYVTKHEASEVKKHHHGMLVMTTTAWLITCSVIRDVMTNVPHPPLQGQYVVKQITECLTTLSTPPHQDETSNATHMSSHQMTTISQPKQCSPSAGKRQQFLSKTAFPSNEGLQKRNDKEAYQEKKDHELRKKFGIVKDVRVHLNRVSLPKLREDSGKASVLEWKVTTGKKEQEKLPKETLPLEAVLPKRREVTRARGVKKTKKEAHSNQRGSTAETMERGEENTLYSQSENLGNTTRAARPSFGKCTEQTLFIQDDLEKVSRSKTLLSD